MEAEILTQEAEAYCGDLQVNPHFFSFRHLYLTFLAPPLPFRGFGLYFDGN